MASPELHWPTPHSYGAFTGLTKSWPIMKAFAIRLNGAVPVVAVVTPVTEYHGGKNIVLPASSTWLIINEWCKPSRQDGLTPPIVYHKLRAQYMIGLSLLMA